MPATDRTERCAALRRTIEAFIDREAHGRELGRLDGPARLQVVAAIESRFRVRLPADLISEVFTLDDLTWFTASLVSHAKEDEP